MESMLDKNRTPAEPQGQNNQLKVELAEGDGNSINEASHYERRCSPSGQQLHLGMQNSLEPGGQVKATKSVLFDTRSTTHAHNKKVQSGKFKSSHFSTNVKIEMVDINIWSLFSRNEINDREILTSKTNQSQM